MKRRNFLKSFLAVPFVLKGKKAKPKIESSSGGGSSGPSISSASSVISDEELFLNQIVRWKIEAAEKAAYPPMLFDPATDDIIFDNIS